MQDKETKPIEAEDVELIERETGSEMLAPRRTGDAMTILDDLQALKRAEQIIEQRGKVLAGLSSIAIRLTEPEQWVLNRDKEGHVLGFPGAAACDRIADVFGIEVEFEGPCEVTRDGETTGYSQMVRGYCRVTQRAVGPVEAVRRSDEKFTGREGRQDDLRNATRTLARAKIIRSLSGLGKVTERQLGEAWSGTAKKTSDCIRGHGFGTSSDRGAQSVTGADVKALQEQLRTEILTRVGGDADAAKQLLVELTAFQGQDGKQVAGVDSVARLTTSKRIEITTRKLKEHPVFGDAARRQ